MFGLSVDRIKSCRQILNCRIDIKQGDIVFITGPSGSGKSVLLQELKSRLRDCEICDAAECKLPENKRVIDCLGDNIVSAMKILNTAGLNDCLCMLDLPVHLSAGQKWRFRLASAIAGGSEWIFSDEFCSVLDRITAGVIAQSIRKYADKYNITFVLASSNDDILENLSPDIVVRKEFCGGSQVIYKNRKRKIKAQQYDS
jgi:hypothetical protein